MTCQTWDVGKQEQILGTASAFCPFNLFNVNLLPRFHNMATDPVADAASKINEAKKKKETGDQAFKTGNLKDGKRVLYSIMNAHS